MEPKTLGAHTPDPGQFAHNEQLTHSSNYAGPRSHEEKRDIHTQVHHAVCPDHTLERYVVCVKNTMSQDADTGCS